MVKGLETSRRTAIRDRVLHEMASLPERIGRYQVHGELGRGGMGVVYDAYDPKLARAVAVKVIHPDRLVEDGSFGERFEREMRATSEAFHENLVSILDAGVDSDPEGPVAYYVMERIVGPSLEERLQSTGPLPRHEALRVASGIARGLAAAHAAGLVHRDLKLSNVLLPLEGGVKIADFGLCNVRGEREIGGESELLLGSAHSIAPEQIQGQGVSGAADIFALGTILVRMLTGREPFGARGLSSHLYRVLHDAPDGLETLDPHVRRLVRTLLSKDPSKRPSDATALAVQLDALADAESRAGTSPLGGGWLFPPSLLRGGAALALALVFLLGGWAFVRMHNQLVSLQHELDVRWSQVENQLARQHELVPQLSRIATRHAGHEIELLRTTLDGLRPPASSLVPQEALRLERDLRVAFALASGIAPVRADAHWRGLAHELAGSKNRIAVERARYNEAVGDYNRRLSQLPWRLLAGRYDRRSYFAPAEGALAEPELDL